MQNGWGPGRVISWCIFKIPDTLASLQCLGLRRMLCPRTVMSLGPALDPLPNVRAPSFSLTGSPPFTVYDTTQKEQVQHKSSKKKKKKDLRTNIRWLLFAGCWQELHSSRWEGSWHRGLFCCAQNSGSKVQTLNKQVFLFLFWLCESLQRRESMHLNNARCRQPFGFSAPLFSILPWTRLVCYSAS